MKGRDDLHLKVGRRGRLSGRSCDPLQLENENRKLFNNQLESKMFVLRLIGIKTVPWYMNIFEVHMTSCIVHCVIQYELNRHGNQ